MKVLRGIVNGLKWFLGNLSWALVRLTYLTYLLIFRSFLYVMTLLLFTYFYLNSSYFLDVLHPILADVLPGAITIEELQYGPVPSQVRIVGVSIDDPNGIEVIEAKRVFATVDLVRFGVWASRNSAIALGLQGAGKEMTPLQLHISSVLVGDFRVLLDFKSDEHLTLVNAFVSRKVDPDDKDDPNAPSPRIFIGNARGENGKVELNFKHMDMLLNSVGFMGGDVIIHHGSADVFVDELSLEKGWMRLAEEISPIPGEAVDMDLKKIKLVDYALEGDEFMLSEFVGKVGEMDLRLEGHLSWWESEGIRFWTDADVQLPASDAIIRRLLGNWLEGSVTLSVSGGGDFYSPKVTYEMESPRLSISGVELVELQTAGELQVSEEKGVELSVKGLESKFGGGRISIQDAEWGLQSGDFSGKVFFEKMTGSGILKSVGVSLDNPYLPEEVTGMLGVDGSLNDQGFQVRMETQEDPLRTRFNQDFMGAFSSFSLDGAVGVGWADGKLSLSAEQCVSRFRGAQVYLDGKWVSGGVGWDGAIELNSLDLDTLSGFAGTSLSGKLSLAKTQVKGEFPSLSPARLRVEGLAIGDVELGQVTSQVSMQGGTVELTHSLVDWKDSFLRFTGELSLFDPETFELNETLAFRLKEVRGERIHLARFVGPGLSGKADLRNGVLKGDLAHLTESLKGTVDVQVMSLLELSEGLVREAGGHLAFRSDSVRLTNGHAMLTSGEYLDFPEVHWNWKRKTLEGDVVIPELELASNPLLQNSGFSGRVRGGVHFTLGPRWSALSGEIEAQDLMGAGLVIGDGGLVLTSTGKGTMALEASNFFYDGKLMPESRLVLGAYGKPRELHIEALFRDLEVVKLFPDLSSLGGDLRFDGKTHLGYYPRRARRSPVAFGIEVDKNGLRGTLNHGSIPVTTRLPASLEYLGDGRWSIEQLTLQSEDRSLELCGTMDMTRGNDMFLRAVTPLDLFGLEKELVSVLEGSVVTAADENLRRLYPTNCFSSESPLEGEVPGYLHVGGTVQAPVIEGTLSLSGLRVRPRGKSIDLRVDHGLVSMQAVRERRGLAQRITFPEPIVGRLGGGQLRLSGDALLRNWQFQESALALELVDVSYSISPELRVRVNADAVLAGETRKGSSNPLTLKGGIDLLEGGYVPKSDGLEEVTDRFDGSEDEGTFSADFMSLGDTVLDMDLRGANFGVRAALPVGETDMELRLDTKIRGTLSDSQVIGRVEALSGGTIRNGVINRQFEVVKATADFDGNPYQPSIQAEVQTEVTFQDSAGLDPFGGSDQVMSTFNSSGPEDKTVVIRALIEGRADFSAPGKELENFELSLTSDSGSYGQVELVPLLVSGVPPGSKGGATTESGASVPIIANDVENLLTSSLLGAFVDRLSLGVSLDGGVDWGLRKLVGENLTLEVRGQQYTEGQSVRPQFDLRLTDRLSLQGAMKYYQYGADNGEQVYETKLRYRIPLN